MYTVAQNVSWGLDGMLGSGRNHYGMGGNVSHSNAVIVHELFTYAHL